jgi:hypothetical protein
MPRGPEGKSALMAAAHKKQNAATTKRFNLANGARVFVAQDITYSSAARTELILSSVIVRKKGQCSFFFSPSYTSFCKNSTATATMRTSDSIGMCAVRETKSEWGSLPEKFVLRTPSGMISTRCQDLAPPFLCLCACVCLCFALACALWQIKETDAYSRSHLPTSVETSCGKKVARTTCMCVGGRNSIVCRDADSHGNEGFLYRTREPHTMPPPFGWLSFETKTRGLFANLVLLFFLDCFSA